MDPSRAVGLPLGVSCVVIRGVVVGMTPFHSERILRVNFAPYFDRRDPHLRLVSCGLAFLFGTKFPPQPATRC